MMVQIDEWTQPDINFLDVVLGELTEGIGEPLFGLIIAAMVFFLLFYASDGRIGVPAIVLTLAGAWVSSVIPTQYAGVAQTIMIIGVMAGVFAIAQRFFLRPTA